MNSALPRLFILLTVAFQIAGPHKAFAALTIPKQLTQKNRETALEILGFGTAPKVLGNPYTLGGYSGYEIGLSTEIIPTADISQLGAKAPQQSDTSYALITFGKGIYNNLDTYVHFGLIGNNESVSNYGGQLRWTLYEAEYIPVFLTFVAAANSANFQNLIITNSQALDLILGVNVDDVTLYLGAGKIQSQGTFMGGAAGVTDTQVTLKENLGASHYLAGVNLEFSKVFLAFQIDRYTQSTYSAKLGMRF